MKTNRTSVFFDTAQARAGFSRRRSDMCRMAKISLSTYNRRRLDETEMTIGELRRWERVVRFTDEEIVRLVRGNL